jgi:5-methylthioribose kinase
VAAPESAAQGSRVVLMQSHGPLSYREMTESRLGTYLAGLPELAARLGERQALWRVHRVAEGRTNLVFIVEGAEGAVCIKQSLPYVRALGESAPLPPERAIYEEAALHLYSRFTPGLVPRVLHYDSELFLLVMERLAPHVTLRRGMIEGATFPLLADHLARFLGEALFRSSDLAMPAAEKKERVAFFCGNAEICRVSEEQIFTEPYDALRPGLWTSPQLDDIARAIQGDAPLKRAIAVLKLRFMTEPQALLHGDLRTGSIMVTQDDTRIIDPEYAFFGPFGFDLGKLLGSLLMAYFAQDGLAPPGVPREAAEGWLLETIIGVWRGFEARFLGLWRSAHGGDAYPDALFGGADGEASLRQAQAEFMRRVLEDALRFAGATMIAQVLGRIRNQPLDAIADPDRRAACERRCLVVARELVKDAQFVTDIAELADVVRSLRAGELDG